jgi:hypothetical protein
MKNDEEYGFSHGTYLQHQLLLPDIASAKPLPWHDHPKLSLRPRSSTRNSASRKGSDILLSYHDEITDVSCLGIRGFMYFGRPLPTSQMVHDHRSHEVLTVSPAWDEVYVPENGRKTSLFAP